MDKKKRRLGDRRDGVLIRDLDALHYITGIIYPNRCDNEAYIAERIDLSNINSYLEQKNIEADPEYPFKFFHLLVTAMVKTITLRPKLNRFIVRGNFYQRNEVSAAFVVKKKFSDSGSEALAFLHMRDNDNLQSVYEKIKEQVYFCRSDKIDTSSSAMDILTKMPRFISRRIIKFAMFLDKHGWAPQFLIATDPYYSSILLSNVGSIKLKSGYHHLTNWGTCSLFCLIGEIKMRPVFDETGHYEMHQTVDLGITIDERLADGYYYARSVRLIKHLLEHPELLELPLDEEVEY